MSMGHGYMSNVYGAWLRVDGGCDMVVKFNLCSFVVQETDVGTLFGGVKQAYLFDLLLEIKSDEEEFPVYKQGGTAWINVLL